MESRDFWACRWVGRIIGRSNAELPRSGDDERDIRGVFVESGSMSHRFFDDVDFRSADHSRVDCSGTFFGMCKLDGMVDDSRVRLC